MLVSYNRKITLRRTIEQVIKFIGGRELSISPDKLRVEGLNRMKPIKRMELSKLSRSSQERNN